MTGDYVSKNRDVWNEDSKNWTDFAHRRWAEENPVWGNWGKPETDLNLLPADMTALKAVELGCGTGYVAYWMAKRGAAVTAIDISREQLTTARALHAKNPAEITFIEGNAEETGLPDGAYDFAFSEYGASIWCPPEKWLAEARRLLKTGGKLVFLGNHPLTQICAPLSGAPTDRTLHRPYRDMWGVDWTEVEIEPSGVCFNLTMSGWMDLFAKLGFNVDKYQEIYAPDWANDVRGAVPAEWARSYPVEQTWHLTKIS